MQFNERVATALVISCAGHTRAVDLCCILITTSGHNTPKGHCGQYVHPGAAAIAALCLTHRAPQHESICCCSAPGARYFVSKTPHFGIYRAMQAGSDLSAAHLIAVRCARLKGDYDESRQYLRTAIAKRPAFGEAWQLLLDIESQDQHHRLARRRRPGGGSRCREPARRGGGQDHGVAVCGGVRSVARLTVCAI